MPHVKTRMALTNVTVLKDSRLLKPAVLVNIEVLYNFLFSTGQLHAGVTLNEQMFGLQCVWKKVTWHK